MYEKGNVSIREEKKIPRMFHSSSHFVNLSNEYVFKFKNLLVMQNFKIVFNSIRDIIPLSEKWFAMKKAVLDWRFLSRFFHKSMPDAGMKKVKMGWYKHT